MEEKIKEHLKSYRATHGKSQKEMAEYLGISYRTYQDMENSGIIKKLDILTRLKEKTGFAGRQKNAYQTEDAGSFLATINELSRSTATLSDSNKELVEAHVIIASTNKSLSESNRELIALLSKSQSSNAVKENQSERASELSLALDRIAHAGVPRLWQSADEGLEVLGRLLSGVPMVEK